MFVIFATKDNETLKVEYSRWCGKRCEAVGFGEQSAFAHEFQTKGISEFLRGKGYGVKVLALRPGGSE